MSETNTVSPLRQHMIEDMAARKLNPHTQRSHIHSCKRFAAWLKRSPDTAMPDEVRPPATSCIGAFRTPAAAARG
jgi:integrase/recombinase XerD